MAGMIIEVETNILRSDITTIEGEISALDRCADRLLQALHELEGMWDGIAKEAFSQQVTYDILQLKEIVKEIARYTGKTSDARQEYDRCEDAPEGAE